MLARYRLETLVSAILHPARSFAAHNIDDILEVRRTIKDYSMHNVTLHTLVLERWLITMALYRQLAVQLVLECKGQFGIQHFLAKAVGNGENV